MYLYVNFVPGASGFTRDVNTANADAAGCPSLGDACNVNWCVALASSFSSVCASTLKLYLYVSVFGLRAAAL